MPTQGKDLSDSQLHSTPNPNGSPLENEQEQDLPQTTGDQVEQPRVSQSSDEQGLPQTTGEEAEQPRTSQPSDEPLDKPPEIYRQYVLPEKVAADLDKMMKRKRRLLEFIWMRNYDDPLQNRVSEDEWDALMYCIMNSCSSDLNFVGTAREARFGLGKYRDVTPQHEILQ